MSRLAVLAVGGTLLGSLIACGQAEPEPTWTVRPLPSPTATKDVTGGTTDVPSVAPARPSPKPTPSRASRTRTLSGLPEILLRIRSCESGPDGYATHGRAHDYDYHQTNPRSSAQGAYQVLRGTWGGYGGYSSANRAPRAVQDAFALQLYRAEGTRPWNASRSCWDR